MVGVFARTGVLHSLEIGGLTISNPQIAFVPGRHEKYDQPGQSMPKNLDQLISEISTPDSLGIKVDNVGSLESPKYNGKIDGYLNSKALSNFAFDHIEAEHPGDQPYVHTTLLLDYDSEAARLSLPYIDLYLPLSSSQAKEFGDASATKKGFLMKDSDRLGVQSEDHKVIPSPFQK